jgi:hypothetical protein
MKSALASRLCAGLCLALAALFPVLSPLRELCDYRYNVWYGAGIRPVLQNLWLARSAEREPTRSSGMCSELVLRTRACTEHLYRTRAAPTMIWFVHFQKCAGSWFVRQAIEHGSVPPPASRNANPLRSAPWPLWPWLRIAWPLGAREVIPLWHIPAEQLETFVHASLSEGTSLMASEYGFPRPSALPSSPPLLLITLLREPVRRATSQYFFHAAWQNVTPCQFFESPRLARRCAPHDANATTTPSPTTPPASITWPPFNGHDFYTDMLNGRAHVYGRAGGTALGPAALRNAQRLLLLRFSAVLIQERMEDNQRLLHLVLGWPPESLRIKARVNRGEARGALSEAQVDARMRSWRDDWQHELRRRSSLDLQLYGGMIEHNTALLKAARLAGSGSEGPATERAGGDPAS